jgi:hypothetical protein
MLAWKTRFSVVAAPAASARFAAKFLTLRNSANRVINGAIIARPEDENERICLRKVRQGGRIKLQAIKIRADDPSLMART